MNETQSKKLKRQFKKKDMKWLEARLEELSDAKEEYYLVYDELGPRWKVTNAEKKQEKLSKIKRATHYTACEYPSMGHAGEEGVAVFTSSKQAATLVAALIDNSSYYYAYVLEWNGPGNYIVKPSYKYDHDNEVIYRATFKKVENNEEE